MYAEKSRLSWKLLENVMLIFFNSWYSWKVTSIKIYNEQGEASRRAHKEGKEKGELCTNITAQTLLQVQNIFGKLLNASVQGLDYRVQSSVQKLGDCTC
jgi:hypothetical protein